MFDAAVYYKTEKGREEMNTRANHLSARLRAALILIDGKTSGRELRVMLGPLGEVEQILQQLIDDGFIESDFDLPSASAIAQTFASLTASGR